MLDNDGKSMFLWLTAMKGVSGRTPAEEQAAGIIDKQLDVATYSPASGPLAIMIERTTPSVSVIIPCYNQAHFLPEAIESALSQTNRAIEVIVVDDGSPDNIAEVVDHYPGIVFVRQANHGLAEARNSGFRASKGEYVVFLDADDRLTPNAVESHLLCFAENPEAGFVVGDIDNISQEGSHLDSPRWPLLQGDVYEDLLKVNHVANTIAVMFRRAVIEQLGGFETSCSASADVLLLLRAARRFPSAHHRTTVADYRRYPATMSRKGTVMLPAILRVMHLQRDIVRGNPRLERARRQGVAYWRDYFGRPAFEELFVYLRRGQLLRAARALGVLVRYVRWQALFMPFKYWRRIIKKLRRVPGQRHSDLRPGIS